MDRNCRIEERRWLISTISRSTYSRPRTFRLPGTTLRNARAWVLGIVCGQPLRRDRAGEFASSGSYEELGKAACALSGEIDTALAEVVESRLDDGFVTSRELWGEGEPHE